MAEAIRVLKSEGLMGLTVSIEINLLNLGLWKKRKFTFLNFI